MRKTSAGRWFALLLAVGLAVWLGPRYFKLRGPSEKQNDEKDAKQGEEGEEEEELTDRIKLSRDEQDRVVLAVAVEVQSRMGLVAAPIAAGTQQPSIKAWGQLEEDPTHTFTLRAPAAGFLEVRDPAHWPRVGEQIKAGEKLGDLGPRLSAVERYDLTTRVLQARAEVDEAEADLSAAKSSYESKKKLNEGQQVVAERTLEEAEAKVKSTEARVAGARQIVQLLEDAISGKQARTTTAPLTSDRAGEVIEVQAQPGETIESGQALLKIADLSRLVARVTTPAGLTVAPMPQKARLQIAGLESRIIEGPVLGHGPSASRGQSFLISVENADMSLRPGALVEANLELTGEAAHGVIVPADAVVRLGGTAYVYLQTAEEQFTRTPIKTSSPVAEGWFVASGLAEKDRVVMTGAGTLLSEELRAQIEAEAGQTEEKDDKEKEKD